MSEIDLNELNSNIACILNSLIELMKSQYGDTRDFMSNFRISEYLNYVKDEAEGLEIPLEYVGLGNYTIPSPFDHPEYFDDLLKKKE